MRPDALEARIDEEVRRLRDVVRGTGELHDRLDPLLAEDEAGSHTSAFFQNLEQPEILKRRDKFDRYGFRVGKLPYPSEELFKIPIRVDDFPFANRDVSVSVPLSK